MSQLLQKHFDLLQNISKSSSNKITGILKHCSNTVLKLFSEVVFNVLKGTISITSIERRKLVILKPMLKALSSKHITLQRKKDILLINIKLVKLLSVIVVKYFEKLN
jgi:hypothetical protein